VLGVGGVIAFIVGSVFLFDPAGADFDLGVAWPLILGAAAASALLSMFVLGAAIQARKRPVRAGAEPMLGARGEVREWQDREGVVLVHGEIWRARSDRPLARGDAVEVVARDGLVLDVRPSNDRS
ncbi:MAG: NfeD family protein, partial [Pseudomonadota bacterium]